MTLQGISFGANAQAQPVSGGGDLKAQVNNFKKNLTNDELNIEKAVTGATVVGVLGTAALLIYKGLKGKSSSRVEDKVAQQTVNVVQDIVSQAADTIKTAAEKSDFVKTTQQTVQQTAQQITNVNKKSAAQKAAEAPVVAAQKTQEALESIQNGTASYQKAKHAAKQNLTHDQKKIVQNRLQQFNSNLKRTEIASEKHQAEIGKTVSDTNKKMNTVKQQTNKITKDNIENFNNKIDSKVSAAKSALEEKQNTINALIEEGKTPTRKQQQSLQRAKNEYIEIEKKAEQAKAQAGKNAEKIAKNDEKKLQNALQYLENTTPEERQLQAMKNNELHNRKLNREFKQK